MQCWKLQHYKDLASFALNLFYYKPYFFSLSGSVSPPSEERQERKEISGCSHMNERNRQPHWQDCDDTTADTDCQFMLRLTHLQHI